MLLLFTNEKNILYLIINSFFFEFIFSYLPEENYLFLKEFSTSGGCNANSLAADSQGIINNYFELPKYVDQLMGERLPHVNIREVIKENNLFNIKYLAIINLDKDRP